MTQMRAGNAEEAVWNLGDWLILDLGFSAKRRSTGVLLGEGNPQELTYGDALRVVVDAIRKPGPTLNLLIEAPLSVAFSSAGNPTLRSIERRDNDTRAWYHGPGAAVLVAALYLVGQLRDVKEGREARLFEGLASFRSASEASSHAADVVALRQVLQNPGPGRGRVLSEDKLRADRSDRLESAFRVLGLDLGIPAVIEVDTRPPGNG